MNKKKLNSVFLETYKEIDKICCDKFGISVGGATEYINRLNNARFAPNRDEVLPQLVRYRNLRNKFENEAKELKKSGELTKADITWLKGFKKDLTKKEDPISAYLKKARRFARRKRATRVFVGILIALIVVGVAVGAYFLLV